MTEPNLLTESIPYDRTGGKVPYINEVRDRQREILGQEATGQRIPDLRDFGVNNISELVDQINATPTGVPMSRSRRIAYAALATALLAAVGGGAGVVGHNIGYDERAGEYRKVVGVLNAARGELSTVTLQLSEVTKKKDTLEATIAGIPAQLEGKEKEVDEKYQGQLAEKAADIEKLQGGMTRYQKLFERVFGKAPPKSP